MGVHRNRDGWVKKDVFGFSLNKNHTSVLTDDPKIGCASLIGLIRLVEIAYSTGPPHSDSGNQRGKGGKNIK